MKNLFEVFAGILGIIIILFSIVLFFTTNATIALLVDLISIITLMPYVAINSFREKTGLGDEISGFWRNKGGLVCNILYIFNKFWIAFLVYKISGNYMYAGLVLIFNFTILTRIVLRITLRLF